MVVGLKLVTWLLWLFYKRLINSHWNLRCMRSERFIPEASTPPKGAPGAHTPTVYHEWWRGGWRTSAVQTCSWEWGSCPWALWPLSHWIVCAAKAEPSEPSALTQIHRQEFPLARTENRQSVLFNAWSKGVVGCIPALRRENGAVELTVE